MVAIATMGWREKLAISLDTQQWKGAVKTSFEKLRLRAKSSTI
jgi:hypothetical protein